MDVNTIVDVIMRYTNNRITLSTDAYQELVAKASNKNYEVDKKHQN